MRILPRAAAQDAAVRVYPGLARSACSRFAAPSAHNATHDLTAGCNLRVAVFVRQVIWHLPMSVISEK